MERPVDLETWDRAAQFRLFRGYTQPHFAVTARIDMTGVMDRAKPLGVSPYRASLFAIGAGFHAVPELRMRFRGDTVVCHDTIALSMTVPKPGGSFGYAYVPFDPTFAQFDQQARTLIEAAAAQGDLAPNTGERDDLAYLSCLPWLDYTSINNALPGPDDCIPRVSWGKIVPLGLGGAPGWSMAMTLEVHHALADGAHVGAFFETAQSALDDLP